VQASHTWHPPGGTLGRILDETRRRLPSLEGGSPPTRPGASRPGFAAALRKETVAVIAEIKRRSPSKGDLNPGLDAGAQARAFEQGGAAAISVLTEPAFFGGSLEDLRSVRSSVRLPVLRKDFHLDVAQLTEAREAQASAVLLIARALSPDELPRLLTAARQIELEVLVEVRSESELERALDADAEIIGVNSRDLETLEIDERVPERLVPMIPPRVIRVWESGVQSAHDVQRAAACGADAVLVGSALSRAADPAALLRSLSGVPRRQALA
jgi:indole-3-glycerol phosphate synthase